MKWLQLFAHKEPGASRPVTLSGHSDCSDFGVYSSTGFSGPKRGGHDIPQEPEGFAGHSEHADHSDHSGQTGGQGLFGAEKVQSGSVFTPTTPKVVKQVGALYMLEGQGFSDPSDPSDPLSAESISQARKRPLYTSDGGFCITSYLERWGAVFLRVPGGYGVYVSGMRPADRGGAERIITAFHAAIAQTLGRRSLPPADRDNHSTTTSYSSQGKKAYARKNAISPVYVSKRMQPNCNIGRCAPSACINSGTAVRYP